MKTLAAILSALMLAGCMSTKNLGGYTVSRTTTVLGLDFSGNPLQPESIQFRLGLVRSETVYAPSNATYKASTDVNNSSPWSGIVSRRLTIGTDDVR